MIKKYFKFVLGILLLPVCFYSTISLYRQLGNIKILLSNQIYFLIGAVSYLILHSLFFKPMRIYIFGHEIMHAIPAWFFGGKLKSFKVSKKGGSVKTTKSNFIIALFPYFLPVYTIVFFIVYLVINIFYNLSGYFHYFIFLIGFSLTFHIVMTVDFLKTKQPDLLETGYLFSLSLIYMVNLCVVVLILMFIFKNEVFFTDFIKTGYDLTRNFYIAAFRQLFVVRK
ncbi:MAG: hypothetical protein FJZ16_01370 [Candidatus Omnitrophica bacterium]|nr:hypothetical protein [Candidatus Omnitrophota bacterium]